MLPSPFTNYYTQRRAAYAALRRLLDGCCHAILDGMLVSPAFIDAIEQETAAFPLLFTDYLTAYRNALLAKARALAYSSIHDSRHRV